MSTTLGADFRTPTFWQRLAFIIAITLAGTFLYSVGVNAFLVPHQFLSGGLTGIAWCFTTSQASPSAWQTCL